MAITQTGTTLQFDSAILVDSGNVSTTITVPSDAEIVIVSLASYSSSGDIFTTGVVTFTKGGSQVAMTAPTNAGCATTAAFMSVVWYLVAPDTGSNKTLAFDWTAETSDTSKWTVTFWKGIDTASPIRDADGVQSGGGLPYTTPTLTAQSGDLIFAAAAGFVDSVEGSVNTWSNLTLLTQCTVNSRADAALATGSPSGNTTVAASTATNWQDGSLVAVVLKPAGGGTAHVGEERVAGAGLLTANNFLEMAAQERPAGVGSLSANVTGKLVSAATFGGAGSLSINALNTKPVAATFGGVGNLSANVIQRHVEGARFNGAGGFSVEATKVSGAVTRTLVSWAQLRGQAPTGVVAWSAQAIFNGSGNLSVDAERRTFAQATFAGAGSLSVNVTARFAIQAMFGGAGSLSVDARNTKPTAATFQGNGNLSASTIQRMQAQATFQGASNLLVEAVILGATVQHSGNALFQGAGNFSANVLQVHQSQARFAGTGSLSANVLQVHVQGAIFNGAGALLVDARKSQQGQAVFNGAGSLSVSSALKISIAATYQGAGSLSVNTMAILRAHATFNGSGNLSVDVTRDDIKSGEASFSGAGNFSARALQGHSAQARLDGTGTFRVNVIAKYAASVQFTGTGNLLISAVAGNAGLARFGGVGGFSVNVTQGYATQARFNGASNLSFSPFLLAFGSSLVEATFNGRGGMSANVMLIGPRHVQSSRPTVSGPVRSNEAVGGRSNVARGTRRNAA